MFFYSTVCSYENQIHVNVPEVSQAPNGTAVWSPGVFSPFSFTSSVHVQVKSDGNILSMFDS